MVSCSWCIDSYSYVTVVDVVHAGKRYKPSKRDLVTFPLTTISKAMMLHSCSWYQSEKVKWWWIWLDCYLQWENGCYGSIAIDLARISVATSKKSNYFDVGNYIYIYVYTYTSTHIQIYIYIYGWWFGTSILFSHSYWVANHPNWRTPSFFRGVAQPPTRYI